jgi:hypothetical protein
MSEHCGFRQSRFIFDMCAAVEAAKCARLLCATWWLNALPEHSNSLKSGLQFL